ncbi:FAD-binding oxidoreductase [Cupriavidus basilensis]|uniref:FAD-binding oxidoreductase n=1 Tax=Cupriavidus basilensis TaxID=68895 RepID=A0ABT6AZS4_9BURK|nr:FAD-binding oxidoreductase [Cupriavidus basilensis]MDF3838129.1 FAD-binding oxidoreductase [Cupriavidus basilensis]
MSDLSSELVEGLKSKLRGQVLLPGEAGYEQARHIWNAMIDRHPALIVKSAGAADVIDTVTFARDNGLLLSVRAGGHNIGGLAMCEGGITLDLSAMKSVRVDPAALRAYVEPGATLADFDHEAQAFGLATPLGINSTTGVAGLTLGGGFGWISRKYGTSVDNLVSAQVVTADGKLLRASATEHPDLFWAIRGGGGNFGVVTMFEFQLHPVGPEIFGGLIVYPLEQADKVLPAFRDLFESMPDDLTVWVVMRQAPPLPFLPPDAHGKPIMALAICYIGPVANGPQLVEPLRHLGTPYGEHVGPMPFTAWQQAFDPLLTPGARNYWKSHNFAGLDDGLLEALTGYVSQLPSPQCEIFIGAMGGQTNRVAPGATAYANRDAKFIMNVHGRWSEAADDDACIAWSRAVFRTAEPYALGSVYVNFMTQEEGDRVGAAYGPNYARLAEVKRQYDPGNLFRHNQNIRPA